MSENFVHPPNAGGDHTLGAVFAGLALIAVPLSRAILGSAESIEPVFWIMLVAGFVMFVYGIAALTLYRRNQFARYAGSDETRVAWDLIRGP
jgi:hypothetical protein